MTSCPQRMDGQRDGWIDGGLHEDQSHEASVYAHGLHGAGFHDVVQGHILSPQGSVPTHTRSNAHILTLTHRQAYSDTHTHTHTQTHPYTHSHRHAYSQTHTHTTIKTACTHIYTQKHSHTT